MSSGAPINISAQYGIALIVFVIVVALAAIAYALSNVSIEHLRYEETRTSLSVLKHAKQALLDSALTYEDSNPGEYGFLPCPDYFDSVIPDEGGSDGNCGAAGENILGLFPWASLETGILKSGTGECLWYAVSGEYKGIPKAAMLNEDSNGAMRLYHRVNNVAVVKQGMIAEDRIIAIIFDPSKVLPAQNRSFDNTSLCGKDYFPAEYLEGDGTIDNSLLSGVALDVDDFIVRGVATDKLPTPFNDQMVTISRNELWDAIVSRQDFISNADSSAMRRLTEALAWCIAEYGNNSVNRKLPRPAAVDFSGLDYRLDGNYSDTAAVSYLGRYPHSVDDSDAALGAANAPNDTEAVIFDKGFCDSLAVTAGPAVNLNTGSGAEGYTSWKNWKDHFFYAVSAYYAPASSADTPVPSCDGTNCISVGVNEYAAVVLYAGSRTGAQLRNEPIAGDADTKNSLANYIEVNNPIGDGTGDYTPTGDDIAYCITDTDPLTVIRCP
jgi:hypothetical protein